jgi:hypothetical protein
MTHTRKAHPRRGYTRKNGVVVKPCTVRTCVVRLPKAKPGQLTKYGYHLDLSDKLRRAALLKAVKSDGYGTIMRRLNWLAVMSKRQNPHMHTQILNDMHTIRSQLSHN